MPRKPANPATEDSKESFERFDALFKGVVSVSNKRVQELMAVEKKKRKRRPERP